MSLRVPSQMRWFLIGLARWTWFGFLVTAAFGYLVSGIATSNLSRLSKNANHSQTEHFHHDDDFHETVQRINQLRQQHLALHDLSSAPAADWLTVCRRMSLALVGCGVSLEEIRTLETLPVEHRASAHLENLLDDSRFHTYWAKRLERQWVGVDEDPFLVFRRRRFRSWLQQAIANHWRYDRMVEALITAKGLWTDQPEVNFLTVTFGSNNNQPDPVRLAARTSRVFLGLRIDCLQCHDDFLGNMSFSNDDGDGFRSGQQSDFHQLAAFFTAAQNSGLQGVGDSEVDYRYQYLDSDSAEPVFAEVPYQRDLLPRDGNARKRLADWITHAENHQAAIAAVNHVWALMLGQPIGDEVDQLPMDQTHPQWLHVLADDFVDHGFDLRRLIRVIATSQCFRVDSRADFEITTDHEKHLAVFPLVRLRPEQIAGSLIQAARVKRVDDTSSLWLQLQKFNSENEFVRRYGDLGEDEFSAGTITISQRLLMMNGKLVAELLEDNPIANTRSHLAMFSASDERVVQLAYQCVLNRLPTQTELDRFEDVLCNTSDRKQSIEDLMWVLINSSEFAWNH